jgi:hypothetical protein
LFALRANHFLVGNCFSDLLQRHAGPVGL